jgi:cell shape-determining protein MreC
MIIETSTALNVICVISSAILFLTRLDATTKSNRQFFENSLTSLQTEMTHKFEYLEGSIKERFQFMEERFNALKYDISRLEKKQEETKILANKIAELETMVQVHIKTQHTS